MVDGDLVVLTMGKSWLFEEKWAGLAVEWAESCEVDGALGSKGEGVNLQNWQNRSF